MSLLFEKEEQCTEDVHYREPPTLKTILDRMAEMEGIKPGPLRVQALQWFKWLAEMVAERELDIRRIQKLERTPLPWTLLRIFDRGLAAARQEFAQEWEAHGRKGGTSAITKLGSP